MTPAEWARVKQLTGAALEQPEAARRAYVGDACCGDEALEREVLSLLSSAATASTLFETPIFNVPGVADAIADATCHPSAHIGSRIGAYRIVREISRGGMGTVFLAE